MFSGFTLWNDAYNQFRQLLCDENKTAHFERYKRTEELETSDGIEVSLNRWEPWRKLNDSYRPLKMWFVRKMSVEDLILDNKEKD